MKEKVVKIGKGKGTEKFRITYSETEDGLVESISIVVDGKSLAITPVSHNRIIVREAE